jgi:AhpD family alkylhydroperoxidase
VTVSITNGCEYCTASHTESLLREFDVPETQIESIADGNYHDLDETDRHVVELAEQATRDPRRVTADHIEALLADGFTEETIIELLLLIGQANLANMIVDAVNVNPEDPDDDLVEYLPGT